MGLVSHNLDLIHHWTSTTFRDVDKPKMLELGDQVIVGANFAAKTGKEYFQSLGYDHVSVDLNGQHGALKLDLTIPNNFLTWHDNFHVITNAGTTEHIKHQFTCFKIIHDCARVGALMIHIVPDTDCMKSQGKWKGHCDHYYSLDFFSMLAENNDYHILHQDIQDQLVRVVLQKKIAGEFMVDSDLFSSKIYNTMSSH